MKKLFFVLVCIFLSFNVFAFDFTGDWEASYEMVEEDGVSERGEIQVHFNGNKCIFYRENSQSVYDYERDDNFFFLAGAGYELKIENEDKFILFPRFGTNIKYIIFVRTRDE